MGPRGFDGGREAVMGALRVFRHYLIGSGALNRDRPRPSSSQKLSEQQPGISVMCTMVGISRSPRALAGRGPGVPFCRGARLGPGLARSGHGLASAPKLSSLR